MRGESGADSHGGGLRANASQLGLNTSALTLLRDLISERLAIHFDDSKLDLLADKVSEAVTALGFSSFLDYYYLLRYDSDAAAHWGRLMDRLSVPETYFWRQADQLEAFANVVAPAHFGRDPIRPLRIWSAACCTGEEPLSIAIALSEAGMLEGRPVEIVASDASDAMLERARAGSYRERSFRQLPPALRDKYFCADAGGAWRPDPALSRHIAWHRANLANTDEWATFAASDVIFCRNVFIYFSDAAIRRVAGTMAERMPPHGHLFLGASESLTRFGLPLQLVEIARSFVYVKDRAPASATLGSPPDAGSGDRLPRSRPGR